MAVSPARKRTVTRPDPMVPVPYKITQVRRELADTFTLDLTPEDGKASFPFLPGQFNMVYAFGAGEVPVSISGDPAKPGKLVHTIRAVGKTTEALQALKKGDVIGIRGPFGSAWPIAEHTGKDIVVVTGGIGLAPLRPVIYHVLNNRTDYGQFNILYGARKPQDILYPKELASWSARLDVEVMVTVDHSSADWRGAVGVVPKLIKRTAIDPTNTIALVCGPEVMMRFSIRALMEQGLPADSIYVSMERNMKCAIGLCGHCQFGPTFVCKDGPVYRFDRIADIFDIREI